MGGRASRRSALNRARTSSGTAAGAVAARATSTTESRSGDTSCASPTGPVRATTLSRPTTRVLASVVTAARYSVPFTPMVAVALLAEKRSPPLRPTTTARRRP